VFGTVRPKSRSGLWFAAFTILSLMMLLASRTEQAETLQEVGGRILDPVRQTVSGVGAGVAGVFGTIGEIDRLRSENDQRRRQRVTAQQRVAELTEAAEENDELRSLLGLTKALDMQLLPVRVISRDPSNFTWEVGIDAGSEQGLEEGMPVVGSGTGGAGALAGTVVSVASDTARVRFIVDTRSSVIAVDQQTRALGLVEGQLGGQLVMVEVQATDQMSEQDTVVTAGLSLGVPPAQNGTAGPDNGTGTTGTTGSSDVASAYPKGLLIGRVQAIEPDPNALTKTAFVQPALDFMKVDRLLVVTSFHQG
jgi:rod shape-determining protein MreC